FIALIIGAYAHTIEFFHRNEVYNAGDCVGAVQGGAAVQYHFHACDGNIRNEAGNGSVHRAHAVHQGQGAVLTQATQVECSPCGTLAAVGACVDVGNGVGVLGIGQITNVLAHVRCAGLVQVFLADGING